MRRLLIATIAVLVLAATAPLASGDAGAKGGPTPFAGKGKKCKKGYVRKRKGDKIVCVKKKAPAKTSPTPGLDIFANPGTYQGSNGVTATTSIDAAGGHFISLKIAFPNGYVSCQGRPPYPSVTISIAEMPVSDLGNFAGSGSSKGAYASIQGHYTGPNSLVLESASASNVLVKGERCAAQYTDASVVF